LVKVDAWLEDSAGPPWAAQVHLHHLLKNYLSDCVNQNDENSLRRSMTEIKTYEEVNTGKTVSCLPIDLNIGIMISFHSV
jgi:hypothetical protein